MDRTGGLRPPWRVTRLIGTAAAAAAVAVPLTVTVTARVTSLSVAHFLVAATVAAEGAAQTQQRRSRPQARDYC